MRVIWIPSQFNTKRHGIPCSAINYLQKILYTSQIPYSERRIVLISEEMPDFSIESCFVFMIYWFPGRKTNYFPLVFERKYGVIRIYAFTLGDIKIKVLKDFFDFFFQTKKVFIIYALHWKIHKKEKQLSIQLKNIYIWWNKCKILCYRLKYDYFVAAL